MVTENASILELTNREYKAGFVTDIESESVPPGLNEDVVRLISAKKNEPEWLLEWRLKAYRHWLTMKEPTWQNVHYPPIDYQSIVYYSAPKAEEGRRRRASTRSIPKLLETYEKLGHPAARAGEARRRGRGRRLRQRLRRDHLPRAAREGRRSSSARSRRRCRTTPSW